MNILRIIDVLQKYRRVFLVTIVLLIPLYILANYGFINFKVSEGVSGEFTYYVGGQQTKSSSPSLSKFVHKGAHEATVTQDGKSYFAVIKTGGFLKKTTVQAKLEPEKSRQFVGNNPSPCMYYDGILYSYECKGRAVFNAHIPATDTLPTYVEQKNVGLSGSFEGLIKTGFGTVILELAAADEDSKPPHSALLLGKGLSPSRYKTLQDLSTQKAYLISPYASGFITYDSGFEQIFYYQSVDASPEIIQTQKPKDINLKPAFIDSRAGSILVGFTNYESADPDKPNSKGAKNEIYIYNNGQTYQVGFDNRHIARVMLCGDKKLCLVENGLLRVYDVSSGKAKELYKISGVKDAGSTTKDLLVIRDHDILSLDQSTGGGFISYSFGDYKYCGSQVDGANYVLCLINNENNKVALRIDQGSINTDSIDKKINELQKMKEIDTVSIYGNHLSVVGNYGPLEFNSSLGGYSYNQEAQRIINGRINKEIDRLKIDRSKYSISL